MDVVNVCFRVFVYFKAFAYEWFDTSTVASVIAVLKKVEEDIRQHALSERISKHSCCWNPNEVANCPLYTVLSQHHNVQSLIPILRDPLFPNNKLEKVPTVCVVINGKNEEAFLLNFT